MDFSLFSSSVLLPPIYTEAKEIGGKDLCKTVLTAHRLANRDLTTIHYTVMMEDPAALELILKHDGNSLVNHADDKGQTALHIAVEKGHLEVITILLKYGADIQLEDASGRSTLDYILDGEKYDILETILENTIDISKVLNRPNRYGITPLQRIARVGISSLTSLAVSKCDPVDIRFNVRAYFTPEELEACTAEGDFEQLKLISPKQFSNPINIAQNFCHTMVRLRNGKILRLRNVNIAEVKRYLLDATNGDKNDQYSDILTAHLCPGHAFLKLTCRVCDGGSAFNETRGYYPSGLFFNGASEKISLFGRKSVNFFHKQLGAISQEQHYERHAQITNCLSIDFHLSDDQSKKSLDVIKNTEQACEQNKCSYFFLNDNCVDFVEKVVGDENGDLFDYVSDSQIFEISETSKAIVYGAMRSRGFVESIKHYAQKSIGLEPHSDIFIRAQDLSTQTTARLDACSIVTSAVVNVALVNVIGRLALSIVNRWQLARKKYNTERCLANEFKSFLTFVKINVEQAASDLVIAEDIYDKIRAETVEGSPDDKIILGLLYEIIDLRFKLQEALENRKSIKYRNVMLSKSYIAEEKVRLSELKEISQTLKASAYEFQAGFHFWSYVI